MKNKQGFAGVDPRVQQHPRGASIYVAVGPVCIMFHYLLNMLLHQHTCAWLIMADTHLHSPSATVSTPSSAER